MTVPKTQADKQALLSGEVREGRSHQREQHLRRP